MSEVRLMPDEIEALETFAETHGIPAVLDHLGLDGLGNQVNGLLEQIQAAERVVAAARNFDARFEERFIFGMAKPLNDALAAYPGKEPS